MEDDELKPEEIIRKLEDIKLWVEKLEANKDGRSKLSSSLVSKN